MGIRRLLRNFTASAVKEHLRSEIEAAAASPDLTPNEIELVASSVRGHSTGVRSLARPSGA